MVVMDEEGTYYNHEAQHTSPSLRGSFKTSDPDDRADAVNDDASAASSEGVNTELTLL